MAIKTKKQHLEERLAVLKDKLSAELAKFKSDPDAIQDLKNSINHIDETLNSGDPSLEKPHGFNLGAVG